MAVVDPWFKEWEQWKREMEKIRRRRWREWVRARADGREGAEGGEGWEGFDSEEESEDEVGEEEGFDSEEESEDEVGEEEEDEGAEVEGDRGVAEKDVEEEGERVIKGGDGEEDLEENEEEVEEGEEEEGDSNETEDIEEEQEEGEYETENEVEESEETDAEEEEENEVMAEGELGEDGGEGEDEENMESDAEEEEVVTEAEEEEDEEAENEVMTEGELGEDGGEGEDEENMEADAEEDEVVTEAEEEEKEVEMEAEGENKEVDDEEEKEEMEAEETEEVEVERNIEVDEEFGRDHRGTRWANEDENLPHSLGSNSSESGSMVPEDEVKSERTREEDRAAEEQREDPEELEPPAEELKVKEEAVARSSTTRGGKDRDDRQNLHEEEEDTTDDEDAGHSPDEDLDYDEDEVMFYYKDEFLEDMFGTLTDFRASSVLTDLTLSTTDGQSLQVHSAVLAAVSSRIRRSLSDRDAENLRRGQRQQGGLHRWSVSLGPEVDHVGLEAVVEFAYAGLVSCLNQDTVQQIKSAAQALDAQRVLDLCREEEEKSTNSGGQEEEESLSAEEQLEINLQSIKQLWVDMVGCDVILRALRGSLHVHRVILAVGSAYFRSMFTLGMKESHQPCVALPSLLASELEVLIDCTYSGVLTLSWSCVFEITTTALQLQYEPVLSLCLKFLQQEINPHSCLDVASFAEAYEMMQLVEFADDYVLRQFQKVACTGKFKDLPAKQLLRYLNSRSLCVSSELVVFKAVVRWIQAKPKRRLRLAKELMKTIHFPLMTFKEFKEVQTLNMWSEHSLAELYEAIFEDFCSSETAAQSLYRTYVPKESLVLIGGDQTSEDFSSRSISRELWFGNSLQNHTGIRRATEWRILGEMPDTAKIRHEVTVLNGQLYVFGGKKYYGTNDILNSVYRYDPLQNSWQRLAEMLEKRCSFSVVVVDGKIYAIGGHCEPEYLESVERYCPIANSWSFTWPLDLPLSTHVAKVLHGQIYVSGGLSSNHQCLASMFLYHPERGSTYLASMAKPRAYHCMETLGDFLYVAGGHTTDDSETMLDQLACEVYSPGANVWTAFTSLPVPHVGAGSAVLEGKFYVLGGYSQEDFSDTKLVHRYDGATQRWENMGKMPGPNNDIRAAVLGLPEHFRL